MKSDYLLLSSMSVVAVVAISVAALAPSHIVRAKSGWSGHVYWFIFEGPPSEKQLYDEVLARESSLNADTKPDHETHALVSAARAKRDAVPALPEGFVLDNPPATKEDPYAGWGQVESPLPKPSAAWDTLLSKPPPKPTTRTEFSPFVTKTVYFVVTILAGIIPAFLASKLIRYLLNNPFFALAAAGLFLAVLAPTTEGRHSHSELPQIYFEILRCVVCGVSFYGAFKLKDRQGWLWTMVAVGLLFNPVVPASFSKEAWQIIDMAAGIFFLVSISLFSKTPTPVSVAPPACEKG